MSTDAEFMDYIEQCCREGGVYGDIYIHMSPNDRIRLNNICSIPWKGNILPTRTTVCSAADNLKRIEEWRKKTKLRVAKKLAS